MSSRLPFSHEAFLDVFAAYNAVAWPAVAVLWAATVVICWRWIAGGRIESRVVFGLLGTHWAWSGLAYHWLFFRTINPAATLFAVVFLLQAVFFAWLAAAGGGRAGDRGSGVGDRGTSHARFVSGRRFRDVLGKGLVVYGLGYPVLGLGFGLQYPRMPVFAVPCPTTLLTAGLLLTSVGVPRFVNIVPILWAIIGSSAALILGIRADLALVAAALLLAVDTLAPSALGARQPAEAL